MHHRAKATIVGVVTATVVAGLIALGEASDHETPQEPQGNTVPTGALFFDHGASDALLALPVSPPAGQPYDRMAFGKDWGYDFDHDNCDTRDDVLIRDLTGETFKDGHCVVAHGWLTDQYTGKVIEFTRGVGTSTAVQIDHVVALSNAWQHGAIQWSEQDRQAFANDPMNLIATDGRLNQSKSDRAADEWLPPLPAAQCPFVARVVAVKTKYQLSVTVAEHDAIARVLSGCPGQPLPKE